MKFRKLDVDPSKILESVTVKPRINPGIESLTESDGSFGSTFLLPKIEAIHAGATRNDTVYPAEKLRGNQELKSGVFSWMHPYPKPVIYNHDVNTEATGRIQSAYYTDYTSAGRPGIVVIPKITSEKAIKDILGGRLLTVSIGAETNACICSYCKTDIIEEGFCGHMKGEVINGQKVEWIVGDIFFDEISWVNVPADSDAMIVDVGTNHISMAESFAMKDREIINLGESKADWKVGKETLVKEGLENIEEEQKVEETKVEETKVEETKVEETKVEESTQEETKVEENTAKTEENATNVEEKEEKEKELLTEANELIKKESEELAESLKQAEVNLSEAKKEVEEKDVTIADLTEKLSLAEKELEEAKAVLAKTTQDLEEEKEARATVLEENARLCEESHKSLVNKVVELRVSLGKEATREESLELVGKRSKESLTHSLEDLLRESKTVTSRKHGAVENPVFEQGGRMTESAEGTKKTVSKQEALIGLFGGRSLL